MYTFVRLFENCFNLIWGHYNVILQIKFPCEFSFNTLNKVSNQLIMIHDVSLPVWIPYFCLLFVQGSEPPSSPQVVEEGADEEDEELSGAEDADLRASSGRGSLLTRRGITLRVLLKDGLVEPGDGVLSIHYLVLSRNFIIWAITTYTFYR